MAMTAYGIRSLVLVFNLIIIVAVHFDLQESLNTDIYSASKMILMCEKILLLSVALVFLRPPHPADLHHAVLYMRFMMFLTLM